MINTTRSTQEAFPCKQRQSIALTGASGYIGQHLLKQLTDEYHVIALSRHGDSKKNSPQERN
ncbi:NAD-dependent epimerase/dehydratase family protein [Paenibacillus sp. IHBB 3054]|uniref:NAD-dependent epimerase/dehydratase family protein n=1 Tax=Paenibacillus sp. IHBB 3054 TaxID=3425689 RepID=UPI003F6619E5